MANRAKSKVVLKYLICALLLFATRQFAGSEERAPGLPCLSCAETVAIHWPLIMRKKLFKSFSYDNGNHADSIFGITFSLPVLCVM